MGPVAGYRRPPSPNLQSEKKALDAFLLLFPGISSYHLLKTILRFQIWCDAPWKPFRNFITSTSKALRSSLRNAPRIPRSCELLCKLITDTRRSASRGLAQPVEGTTGNMLRRHPRCQIVTIGFLKKNETLLDANNLYLSNLPGELWENPLDPLGELPPLRTREGRERRGKAHHV